MSTLALALNDDPADERTPGELDADTVPLSLPLSATDAAAASAALSRYAEELSGSENGVVPEWEDTGTHAEYVQLYSTGDSYCK